MAGHNDLDQQIFVLTFNTNSCDISEDTLQQLFEHEDAPIVVAAFQEYDFAPSQPLPKKPFVFAGNKQGRKLDNSTYLRQDDSYVASTASKDIDRLKAISAFLGDDYVQLVDVAMGEPAREIEGPKNKEIPEWFGFIRLIVWANPNTPAGSILCNDDDIITCIIPTGDKKSQYVENDNKKKNKSSTYDKTYDKNAAPDKGAVAAYFPNANLMLTSIHLAGTNQYGVKEEYFDDIRISQLVTIEKNLSLISERYSPIVGTSVSELALIMSGDLNFRVESNFQTPVDKEKGGKDFMEIEKVASNGDALELASMFGDYDRLNKHLSNSRRRSSFVADVAQKFPSFLMGSSDTVAETLLGSAGNQTKQPDGVLRPTFTFKVDAKYPRKYKDKRTPSWPDRILAKGKGPLLAPYDGGSANVIKCQSLPKITCSDHEPLIAFLSTCNLEQLKKASTEIELKHIQCLKRKLESCEEEDDDEDGQSVPLVVSPLTAPAPVDCCVPNSVCSMM